jgi:ABC-type uncharacterized transport system substrate-binding protein
LICGHALVRHGERPAFHRLQCDLVVATLPPPGGNVTGFSPRELSMASKWVGLLTKIAPGVKRTSIMFNPDTAPGGGS